MGGRCGALALAGLGGALGLLARSRRTRVVGSLLLACAAGLVGLGQRLDAARGASPASAFEVSVEARVARVWHDAAGPRLELASLRALDASPEGLPARLWLTLDPDAAPRDLRAGTRLRARLRVLPFAPLRNPGRPRDARRLARRGIAARARLVHPDWWIRVGPAPTAGLASWRARVARRLARAGEGGALLAALGLGDRSALSSATRDAFRSLGIAHLLAVSGLHLALVAGGAFWLARRALCRCARVTARLDAGDVARVLALLAALLYAALCGLGVPVRRALVLLAALVVSTLRGRRAPRFHPIAAAGLLVLAVEPDALFQGGAQLSFAACAALVRGAGRRRAGSASRWRAALHGSSLAVAVTAPLAAWHWGTAAPLAVVVNLVAIPWTAALLLPAALLATALAALAGQAPSAVLDALVVVAAWSLRGGNALAACLPPLREVEVHPMALVAAAALAGLALCSRDALATAALAGGIGLLLRCAPPPAYAPPPPRLVVFDVGRGDAVLVQGRAGALLVDGAAAYEGHFDLGRSAVVPALRALRIQRLDLVVASHADLDHRGGLPSVLSALPVGGLWLPPGGRADPDFAALRAAAQARGVAIEEVGRGVPELRLGDLRVQPVWPPLRPSSGVGSSRNERSLGLRIELSGRRILLLGDLGRGESALIDAGGRLAADVLLLPHHGSAGSSSAALLRAVSPSLALVSAPCPPRRGLPHPESLTRARAAGASVWWTGRDGALLVGLGRPLVVLPFAERRMCGVTDPDPPTPARPPREDQRSMPSTSRS